MAITAGEHQQLANLANQVGWAAAGQQLGYVQIGGNGGQRGDWSPAGDGDMTEREIIDSIISAIGNQTITDRQQAFQILNTLLQEAGVDVGNFPTIQGQLETAISTSGVIFSQGEGPPDPSSQTTLDLVEGPFGTPSPAIPGAQDIPTPSPLGVPSPNTAQSAAERFRLLRQADIAPQFREELGATPGFGGGPLGAAGRRFFEGPATSGFQLAPFLQPERDLSSLDLRDFLGPQGLFGAPDPQQIFGALQQAAQGIGEGGAPRPGLTDFQSGFIQDFAPAERNQDVFNLMNNAVFARQGTLFGPSASRARQRAFDMFNRENQGVSFLNQFQPGGNIGSFFPRFGG